jgi:rhamnosyltransferase
MDATPPALQAPLRANTAAVIISLNPDSSFFDRMHALLAQVEGIIIVDNASRQEIRARLDALAGYEHIHLISNPRNMGVAAGLNQGFKVAMEDGASWVWTLDQDSVPSEDMIRVYHDRFNALDRPQSVAIFAPKIIDVDLARSSPFLRKRFGFFYQRTRCGRDHFTDVTTVITSGALFSVEAYRQLGGFREDFFIDYVDTEYCLRAIEAGLRIVVDCRAELEHRLGARREVQLGPFKLYPTFHPPARWYTISRNRIHMIRSQGLTNPHWLIYEAIASIFITFRMLLTESQKMSKIRAILQGTYDGLRGRLGPPPWAANHS